MRGLVYFLTKGKILANQTSRFSSQQWLSPHAKSMDFRWSLAQTSKDQKIPFYEENIKCIFFIILHSCSLNKNCCGCWMGNSSLRTERLENVAFLAPNQETDTHIQIESRTRQFLWAQKCYILQRLKIQHI